MNNVFLVLLISIFSTTNIFAEEHKQNGTNQENVLAISQNQIKVATVDFQRILRESQIGRQYLKSAKTNIDKKCLTDRIFYGLISWLPTCVFNESTLDELPYS